MAKRQNLKHRVSSVAPSPHAKAGATALAVVTAVTAVTVTTGSLFAPSGASTALRPPPASATSTTNASSAIKILTDFEQQSAGIFLPSGALAGRGVGRTIYRLPAKTSAKTATTTGTNQYYLMRTGGLSSAQATTLDLGGFTVRGTDQSPHLGAYGGVAVGWGTGTLIHDLKVTGVPGYSAAPPGETFSLNLWHSDSATLKNVTLNGERASDGADVAATLLGYNFTTGHHTITNLAATHAQYGFGVAMFQASGTYTFNGCNFSNDRKAINLEQSEGATYNFNKCTFHNISADFVAQVSSIGSSSPVYIRDPQVDSWPLKVNTYSSAALSGQNVQKDSDIHLIINGVDETHNPSYFQIVHGG